LVDYEGCVEDQDIDGRQILQMVLKGIVRQSVQWISQEIQVAVVNTVMNFRDYIKGRQISE